MRRQADQCRPDAPPVGRCTLPAELPAEPLPDDGLVNDPVAPGRTPGTDGLCSGAVGRLSDPPPDGGREGSDAPGRDGGSGRG